MKNDSLAVIDRLAAQANEEDDARIDVTDQVLVMLRSREATSVTLEVERAYVWIVAGSLVAACVSLVFGIGVGDDSLWALTSPFITVLQ